MKDPKKNRLTDAQFQIYCRQLKHTGKTEKWLRKEGFDREAFDNTPIELLKAQRQAHHLLTHNSNLLTTEQQSTLRNFQQLMAQKRTRNKLKPEAANQVLNISSKINRQLFKQHRQLNKAQA